MSLDTIKKMFKDDGPRTLYAEVVGRVGTGRVKVRDVAGRELVVQSTAFWPAGSKVRIEDGVITGRGVLAGKHKHYEV